MGELKYDENGESEAFNILDLFYQMEETMDNDESNQKKRKEVIGAVENLSLSSNVVMAFFASFVVAYLSGADILISLLISSIISLGVFFLIRKRRISMNR
jgi:hypothetical protein